MGRSVRLSDDDMGMESRISIVKNNISYEGENLNLFSDRDLVKGLLCPIEIPQRDVRKGPNCGEVTGLNLPLPCKGEQTRYHFVSFFKNDCVCFFPYLVYQFRFHDDDSHYDF